MRFAKSTGVFYPKSISYPDLPGDVIDVSLEDFALAMARNPGDALDVVDGHVVVVPKKAPSSKENALEQIARLEAAVTPRRLREAALGEDGGWLKSIDAEIAELRKQLI